MDLNKFTVKNVVAGLREKKFSSVEVIEDCRKRYSFLDKKIRAFLAVDWEKAKKKAASLDKDGRYENKLAGVPSCVKDVFCAAGMATTAGSKTLKGFIPPYNATVVEKLMEQDSIVVGKGNCDCFAFGGSGENSGYYPTLNPWDFSRVPGGSSSGPAAAVAADEVIFSLGTDTGGSIRQPAGFCGIVGVKPTYGRASRYGLIAMGSSFDTPGPFTKNVEDAALLLEIISGTDSKDATTSMRPVGKYSEGLEKGVSGLRIGLPKEFFIAGTQKEVNGAVLSAVKKLESLGAIIENISLPHAEYALAVYYVLVPCEISANMARYDGIHFGHRSSLGKTADENITLSRSEAFEDELKRRIMIGTFALSAGYYEAFYKRASQVRALIIDDFRKVFEKVDLIISPTSPTTAFKLGERINDPLKMYLADVFTVAVSVAGIPAISLPCGFDNNNLPIGLQIMANQFDEERMFAAAYAYEQATDWHKKKPNI